MGLFDTFKKSANLNRLDGNNSPTKTAPALSRQVSGGDRQENIIVSVTPEAVAQHLLFVNVEVGWMQAVEQDLARLEPSWSCHSVASAELQVLGTTHAELAACLMGNWALPLPVLEAVAWHHVPKRSSDQKFTLLTAVHVANVFAFESSKPTAGSAVAEQFDHEYLDQIGLGDHRNDWRKACKLPTRQDEDAKHALLRARRAAKTN